MNPKKLSHTENLAGDNCPQCNNSTQRKIRNREYKFTAHKREYVTTYDEPVDICATCEMEFTGEEAENAQYDAVCRALGRLTPTEIADIESKYSLSTKDFAEILGVGEASLRRWKNRISMQDVSNDKLLRIADSPDGPRLLGSLAPKYNLDSSIFVFMPRVLQPNQISTLRAAAAEFRF